MCAGAAAGGRLAALRLAELALDGDAPAALAALLASPCPLTILDLDRVRAFVDADGPTKLREGLARRRARGAAPLDALSLDGVILGDAGAVALAGGDVSAESSSPSALPVRSLSLRGCGVGAAGARALAAAIASTETLRLGENTVGDDGAVSLAEALANASSLATLDVSSNGVGAVGAAALVREATTLRELSLFGNEAIGDAGLAAATRAAGRGDRAPRRSRTSTREDAAPRKSGSWRCARRSSRARTSSRSSRRWWWVAIRGRRATRGNPRWVGCGTRGRGWTSRGARRTRGTPRKSARLANGCWRSTGSNRRVYPRRRREGEGDARALEYRSPRRRAFGAMTILTISRAPKEYIARHSHRNVHPHRSLTHWVENRHASPRSCLTAMESRVS